MIAAEVVQENGHGTGHENVHAYGLGQVAEIEDQSNMADTAAMTEVTEQSTVVKKVKKTKKKKVVTEGVEGEEVTDTKSKKSEDKQKEATPVEEDPSQLTKTAEDWDYDEYMNRYGDGEDQDEEVNTARLSAIFNKFENPDARQEKKAKRPLPSVDLGRLKEKFVQGDDDASDQVDKSIYIKAEIGGVIHSYGAGGESLKSKFDRFEHAEDFEKKKEADRREIQQVREGAIKKQRAMLKLASEALLGEFGDDTDGVPTQNGTTEEEIIISSEEVKSMKSKFEEGPKSKEIKKSVEKIDYEGLGNLKGKFEGQASDSTDTATAEKQRKIQEEFERLRKERERMESDLEYQPKPQNTENEFASELSQIKATGSLLAKFRHLESQPDEVDGEKKPPPPRAFTPPPDGDQPVQDDEPEVRKTYKTATDFHEIKGTRSKIDVFRQKEQNPADEGRAGPPPMRAITPPPEGTQIVSEDTGPEPAVYKEDEVAAELRQIREARSLREKFEQGVAANDDSDGKPAATDETLAELELLRSSAASTRQKFHSMEQTSHETTTKEQEEGERRPPPPRAFTPPPEGSQPTMVHDDDDVHIQHLDTEREKELQSIRQSKQGMLARFKSMEEQKEETRAGPPPPRAITPPPEGSEATMVYDDAEPDRDPNVVRSDVATDFDDNLPDMDHARKLKNMFEQKGKEPAKVEKTKARPKRFTDYTGGPAAKAEIEKCWECENRVYPMERMEVDRKVFHKMCFKCAHCHCQLRLERYANHEGVPFCVTHFKELFGNKASIVETGAQPAVLSQ
ncbi:PREDICTED: uncharacterized protein LOC106807023 isoform X8 [Priapulus caudatus]|uniref:Uncharacterized protein LOC106807023 isoform X8 n=2 Tax=Priapulus caudatus TaxID=37621 RepID=A0ABM1DXV1_PRICU|nr:PREDICTED: uncharacterized protein LOC106807023 isoform X8 [Priapulus caudatus]